MRYSTRAARKRLIKRVGEKCQWCGTVESIEFHMHHIVRVVDGGNDSDKNVILLCIRCHSHADKQSRRVAYFGSGAEFLKDTYK